MTAVIPPSPSKADYAENPEDIAPIFDCDDPFALFGTWLADAKAAEPNDANAMSLATVDDSGLPDVRMVLLKDVDTRGFTFYSNETSAKGAQLAVQPKAALCFHWKSLRKQVRVRGAIEVVSGAEADAYFASRARGAQIGAWASDQSSSLESRSVLESRIKEIETRYQDQDVPRPPHWHGWRITPVSIEFWRDRAFRLHDRLVFTRERVDTDWQKLRLYP